MYVDPTNHSRGIQDCVNGWEYLFEEKEEWTIVSEWDLVCDRKYLVGLVTTAYFGGTLFGAPLLGGSVDKFGRKPIFLITSLGGVLIGVIQYFSSSYIMFIILKFFHGSLLQGMITAVHNLNMELFRQDFRTEAALLGSLTWTVGQFALCFIAYLFPNWRNLYLATSVPSIITILYIWLLPESLRWLIVNGKVDKATKVAQKYVKFNNLPLKPSTLNDEVKKVVDEIAKSREGSSYVKPGFADLVKTKYIRRTALATVYMWFSASVVYYGINFTLPKLAGNKYTNFAISAAVELCSRIILYPALKKIGRRLPTAVAFISSGLLCIASAVLGNVFSGYSEAASIASISSISCALVGKAACSISFACVILLTTEVFPTIIRGAAIGTCGFFSRVGGMTAPQVILLGEYTSPIVPLCLFGVAAVIAGCATLTMPETINSVLPDTINEGEVLCSKGKLTNDSLTNQANTERRNVGVTNPSFQDG